jgi:hypothetical protein
MIRTNSAARLAGAVRTRLLSLAVPLALAWTGLAASPVHAQLSGATVRAGSLNPVPIQPITVQPVVFCGAWVRNNQDSGTGSLRAVVATPPAFGAICFDTAVFNASAPAANRTIVVTTPISLAVNVWVEGPGASIVTVSGNNASGVFDISPGIRATLAGITISRGNTLWGAGIYNGGTLRLVRAVMRDNAGRAGGAIYNAGTMTLLDSSFSNNTATWNGGAIYDYYGGSMTMDNCTLENNRADISGGAIAKIDGAMTVEDSVIRNNVAVSGAGGIFNRSDTAVLTRSRVENNDAQAGSGGGVLNVGYGVTTMTLVDSQITGNHASVGGGGVANTSGATLALQGTSAVTGNLPDDIR